MAKKQIKTDQGMIQNNQDDSFNIESAIDSPAPPSELKKRINECI